MTTRALLAAIATVARSAYDDGVDEEEADRRLDLAHNAIRELNELRNRLKDTMPTTTTTAPPRSPRELLDELEAAMLLDEVPASTASELARNLAQGHLLDELEPSDVLGAITHRVQHWPDTWPASHREDPDRLEALAATLLRILTP